MTTRDDLVKALRRGENYYPSTLVIANMLESDASALEAKDAEIARLNKCYDLAIKSRLEWREQAERLERQLAEETERCARVAESGRDHMLRTAQRDEVKHVKHAVDSANIAAGALNEIDAAIRGGAK